MPILVGKYLWSQENNDKAPANPVTKPFWLRKWWSIKGKGRNENRKMVTSLSVNFPRSARKLHVYDCQYGKNHLHDLQALLTFLERYLVAFTPPTARRPDMACLALETITLCLRILCKQFAATSLALTLVSCMNLPEITIAHFFTIWHTSCYSEVQPHHHELPSKDSNI